MKRKLGSQQKLLFILVIAILTVCAGFIFISCGKGPQSKIAHPDSRQFAIDFTKCEYASPIQCRALLGSTVFISDAEKKIANKNLTIEAWVKSKASTTSTFTGGIFGRFDTAGIMLYVKGGEPKAAIRRVIAFYDGNDKITGTPDYIVSSGMQILDNSWHHIAAVLTGEDHSIVGSPSYHDDCGTTDLANKTDTVDCPLEGTICNNNIHLDIYVDGKYKECNATYGANYIGRYENESTYGTVLDTTPPQSAYADEPGDIYVSVGVFAENLANSLDGLNNATFPGVIDEARLWGIARTQRQIKDCKSQELSLDSGTCGRITPSCISYFRLNEGDGATINDYCGLGTGVLEIYGPPDILLEWTTGWTTNTPKLDKHD